MSTVDKVTAIADPVAAELGYELVDVEYVKEGKNWFLRLYIDKDSGIDLDDCTRFSEKIGETLDSQKTDPIPHPYYLEVSSPGAERPLKKDQDLRDAVEKYVHVSLYQQIDGENIFEGTLKEVTDDSIKLVIRIKTREKELTIERANIAKARLAIKF
ncbi:ribosome maturation factor RimP [Marinilactibacillus sp. Marseille-P9653]|uniref:ribosome maturation factor RimP n=1 Tax=Marinilactibacillus sp. Marseille-P9653 TaxID=2866583 RepID=UPI001CE44699|nr:ribosome maturation factor RimP [Marinilactibacillus sp. Marseille-P9653]